MSFLGDIGKKLAGEWDYGTDKQKPAAARPAPATTRTAYSQPVQPARTVTSRPQQPFQAMQQNPISRPLFAPRPQTLPSFNANPINPIGAVIDNFVKPTVNQFVNTAKNAQAYGQSVGANQARSDIQKRVDASMQQINSDQASGKINEQRAINARNSNMAILNKASAQANQATKPFQAIDPAKAAADAAGAGLTSMTLGNGKPIIDAFGNAVVKPLFNRVVQNTASNALLGSGFNALSQVSQTGSDTTPQELATAAGTGALFGGALGAGGTLAVPAVKGAYNGAKNVTTKLVQRLDDIKNQPGYNPQAGFAKVPLNKKLAEFASRNTEPTPQVSKTPTPFEQALQDAGIAPRPQVVTTISKKASEAMPIDRGFVGSVQGAKNVTKKVKTGVTGTYTPKTNDKLMGETKALLQDGVTIDFKNTKNLDQKVAATIQEALNAQKAGQHELAANLFNNLSEHGTELGRGVQAFSLLQNMSPESVALSVAGKIKKFNATHNFKKIPELGAEQMKVISDRMTAIDLLKPGREKNIALNELNNTMNELIPSSIADKAIAVWKAGLLTSLRTHERNFVGNAVHGIAETAKDIPATMTDAILGLKTGTRTKTMTLRGSGQFGSKETRQQIADIVSKGYDPADMVQKFDYKTVNWGEGPIQQALKKYTNVVFNTLGAEDKMFYNPALARSLYDQAGAAAINAGKRGNAKFIEKLVKNPTEEMMKIAIGDANVAVFKNKNMLTRVVNQAKQVLDKNELSKVAANVFMPFTGVPSSIAGQMVAYSPIGLIQGIARSGAVLAGKVPEMQRQAAQEVGRGVIGTGLIGLGAYLTQQGLMTGQPKDTKEADQWALEGKQANSINIGGQWRSINSVGPEALVLLAGSKIAQGKDAGITAANIGKDFTGQTFLQGMSQPLNAIADPVRYGQSYISNQITSVIPNIVKDTSKAFDPTQRETKGTDLGSTIGNALQSGIPGLRNNLLPKRDVLGNEMKQEPTGLGAYVDLFNSKTPVKNPVVNELSRLNAVDLNATPSAVSNSANKAGVKMTPQELDKLEAYSGGQVTKGLGSLISSASYGLMTDEQKKTAIDSTVQKIKTQAKSNIASGNTSDISVSAGVKLDNLKLTYQQHLDAYNKGVKDGTITGPDVMTKQKSLAKEAITSQYSSEVKDFYNLSNANKNAYFQKDPAKAQQLYDQSKQMDSQLTGTNAATTKYKSQPVEQWRDPVSKVFPASEVTKMLWVIQHESGGNSQAVGDGGAAYGLFQDQHIPSGASVEQQLQNAFKLYTANKAAGGTGYGDWGEGTSYNGQKFGALGNNPYPGDAAALAYLASAKGSTANGTAGSTANKSGTKKSSTAKKSSKNYKLFGFTQADPQSVGKNLRKLIEKAVI